MIDWLWDGIWNSFLILVALWLVVMVGPMLVALYGRALGFGLEAGKQAYIKEEGKKDE